MVKIIQKNQSTSQNQPEFTQTHPTSLETLGNHRNNRKVIKNHRYPTKKMVSETPTISMYRLVYPLVYLFSKTSTERVLGKYLTQISDFEVKMNGESRKNTQNDQR